MNGDVIRLPLIRFTGFRYRHDLDFLEQRDREWSGLYRARLAPPPRTRPLLVIDNDRGRVERATGH